MKRLIRDEPSAAELAEIEREMPLIDAEVRLLDAQIHILRAGHHGPSDLDLRRLHNAERDVAREAAAFASRSMNARNAGRSRTTAGTGSVAHLRSVA